MITAAWTAIMVGLMTGGVFYGYKEHWQHGSWLIPVTIVLVLIVLGKGAKNRRRGG